MSHGTWLESIESQGKVETGTADVDPLRETAFLESLVRTLLGDRDEALEHLRVYLDANPAQRRPIAEDTSWWYAGIREDPRFRHSSLPRTETAKDTRPSRWRSRLKSRLGCLSPEVTVRPRSLSATVSRAAASRRDRHRSCQNVEQAPRDPEPMTKRIGSTGGSRDDVELAPPLGVPWEAAGQVLHLVHVAPVG